jgi:hypothetical protein
MALVPFSPVHVHDSHRAQSAGSITIEDTESGALLDVTIMGGSITRSERDGWEHMVEGTTRPGETISIAASGHGSTWTGRHHVNEDLDTTLSVWFRGTDVDESVSLAPGESGSLAASLVVPGDTSTVEAVAILSAGWINPYGGGSRSLITRISLDVVEPTSSMPADTTPPVTTTAPPDDCDEVEATGPNRENAIVRFGDLHGEVNIRRNCEDDDAYVFAELTTPVRHDDRIRTRPRSGAILSFSDMTSFVIRENSIIVLDIASPRESKIGLVAGNVWVNLKRMVEDGSMEISMAQAVAGIKGTTLVAEETGTTSTVKVFEGTVVMRPRVGAEFSLGTGQMVEVTAAGAGPVTDFDVTEELAAWDDYVRQVTRDAIEVSTLTDQFTTGSTSRALGLGVVALALLAAGAVLWSRHGRRRTAANPS